MIPNSWQETTIGNICDFENGHGFRPPDWSKSGLPIIRIQNLNGSKDFNYFAGEPEKYWLVEPGTLLFAWAGVKGVSFGPKIWDGPKGVLNQHIYKIHPKANIDVDLYWLYAMLRVITSRIEKNAHGFKASLLHVHKADITGQEIYLPPFPEQRKIADILNTWDEAIDLTEQLIAAKQKRKQALMHRLLTGKQRFPEFEALEWREVLLGDLFIERKESGYTHLPLLSITNEEGIIYRDTLDRRDTSNTDKSKYLRICPGDIGYNTMRMWQGVSAVSKFEGIVSPAYTVCIPKTTIHAEFMSCLFKFRPIVHLFWRYSQGLVDDTRNLKFDDFATIKVMIPEKPEQEKIANVLATCDSELNLLQQKLAALRQQKQGLMQQLLTGKMRVKG